MNITNAKTPAKVEVKKHLCSVICSLVAVSCLLLISQSVNALPIEPFPYESSPQVQLSQPSSTQEQLTQERLTQEGLTQELLENEREIELPEALVMESEAPDTNKALAGVYGSISSVGSDTLATLISLWAEAFKSDYPQVKFQIQASGSATAPQALSQGTATIGPMSRALTASEISRFTQKYGYPPTTFIVAVDAIAIYVEKNNPLQQLHLREVDALFSATRFCGAKRHLNTWNDLGVTKFGTNREVLLYGRNSASGTYDLFKQQGLCEGDYKPRVNELPGSASVVLSIASSVGGLGYAAMGYDDDNVKALPIGVNGPADQVQYIAPTTDNITSGAYPFSRYLYIVVNKAPNEPLPILERAFLQFILSDEGQAMVSENGYYPINQELKDSQLQKLVN